jgi:hypothetical protein
MWHTCARLLDHSHILLVGVTAVIWLALGAAPAAGLSFTVPYRYATGPGPEAVAAADLNGDGMLDVVTADADGDAVGVRLGRIGGGFGNRASYPAGDSPRRVVSSDLDADGDLDLITADNGRTVSVLLGDGHGGFAPPASYACGARPRGLAVADFDGDGHEDIAVAALGPLLGGDGSVGILAGDGAGGFSAPRDVLTGPVGFHDVAAADFDGDGDQDLAAVYTDDLDGTVAVLRGDGEGGFAAPDAYTTWLEPVAVAVGDLNGDGAKDLVTAQRLEGTGDIGVLLGDGAGGFALDPFKDARLDRSVYRLALADVNGDGRQDVVTATERMLVVLRGDGLGGFQSESDFSTGAPISDIATGDFNRDGLQDVAVTDPQGDTLGVLLNGPRALPVIFKVSPVRGAVGITVTVTGHHFGAVRGRSTVRFGTTTASRYLSWNSTRIKLKVPAGTAKGLVHVTVKTVAGRSAPAHFRRL